MKAQRYKQKAKYFSDKVRKTQHKVQKTIALLCSAAVIATAVPLVSTAGVGAQSVIYAATTDNLNLRKGAGMSYSVVKVIPKNTTVTVIDTSKAGWLKVKLSDGTTGYCSSEYLDITTNAKTTDYLNLRKGAGTNYSVIKTIKPNVTVDIIKFSGSSWAQVKLTDGTSGYVSTDYIEYITTDKSVATTTVTAKTTDYLNLRKGAGMSYAVIKVVAKGTTVTVTDMSNSNWYKVKLSDGTTGYCSSNYLSITKNNTLKLSATKVTLSVGDSKKITATASSGGTIKWTSSNAKVATVSSTGEIKAVASGTATITATDSKTNLKATCKVTVQNPDTIKISNASLQLEVGGSKKITATASSGGTIKWTSSNTKVATVSSSGGIKAVASGTATITATDSKTNLKATCKVTVKEKPEYTSITLSDTSKTLTVGSTFTLEATTTPSGGKVNFKSNNTTVAKVDENGIVTAIKEGTATITAYDSTETITETCTVTVQNPDSITLSKSSVSVNAGSSVKITATPSNSSMELTWSSSNLNIASVNNGVISGLKSGTATITVSDQTGTIKAICTVTVKSVSSSGVSISRSSATMTAGKNLYIKGSASSSASWYSSDTDVATVSKGFVYAKKAGRVAISYKNSSGHTAICVVTINDAAPIRFAYSSPNSATLNSTVTLVAITDKQRTKVTFKVNIDGKTVEVPATSKTADGDTYVWKGTLKITTAGTFDVTAYSYKDGTWKTCDDGKTDIYVSSKTNSKTTSLDELRASDEVIKFIGEKEGFVSQVTPDTLANNIPTLGYGYVVWEGQTFYNNLTKNEGYALLVNAVNNDSYTSAVNSMLIDNKIKFNQQQFDALVSFSYNLGTGWTKSSDLKNILLNSISTSDSSDAVLTGTVTSSTGLNLRSEPTTSSNVIEILEYKEKVTILSSQKYNSVWYKVKTSSGKTGYCSSTYLNVTATGSVVRDLNYVNKNALITEMLSYHHASGVCYYGLLYRRADELEMFLYGDYISDGNKNKYNFPSPSSPCISFK